MSASLSGKFVHKANENVKKKKVDGNNMTEFLQGDLGECSALEGRLRDEDRQTKNPIHRL